MSHQWKRVIGGLAAFCLSGWIGAHGAQIMEVRIDSPSPGAQVEVQAAVQGHISDPRGQVYVLVRPVKSRFWWVQQIPAPANRDGSWEARAQFGEAEKGIEEDYQIIALVTSKKLKEGQMLETLPHRDASSDVVKVRRVR